MLIAESLDILQATRDECWKGEFWTPIAAANVRDKLPYYLATNVRLAGHLADARDFLHIELTIADRRDKTHRSGGAAGIAIIDDIRDQARAAGKSCVFTDCWAGNDGRLDG